MLMIAVTEQAFLELRGDHFYKIVETSEAQLTHDGAKAYCKRLLSNLVIVRNSDECRILKRFLYLMYTSPSNESRKLKLC